MSWVGSSVSRVEDPALAAIIGTAISFFIFASILLVQWRGRGARLFHFSVDAGCFHHPPVIPEIENTSGPSGLF